MAQQAGELPPRVIAALEQGKKVEAVKLLRQATGLGLREAMQLIDSRMRAAGRVAEQPAPTRGAQADSRVQPSLPGLMGRMSPEEARRVAQQLGAALKRGDWSEAIRHFGTLAGTDTKKTSQTVDKLAAKYKTLTGNYTQTGLSPGEVPRTPLWQVYLIVIVLGMLAYYLLFGAS